MPPFFFNPTVLNNRLDTLEIIDDLRSIVDDLYLTGEINNDIQTKIATTKRILRALNSADIDVCGYLKPISTAVLYLPAGESELNIRRAGAATTGSTQLPASFPEDYLYLDNFVEYSQIRSGTIEIYSEYPLGSVRRESELEIVPFSKFNDFNPSYPVASVDYFNGRIRFSTSFSTDKYISFQAIVSPLSIALGGMIDPETYKIRTPHYAYRYFLHLATMNLIPKNSNYYSVLSREVDRERIKAYDNMPVEVGVVQLTGTIFDDFD